MDKPKPLVFDGMNMPPLRPLRENAEKRFTEIRDLECMKDDIILATYSKSGIIIYLHYMIPIIRRFLITCGIPTLSLVGM